MQKWFLLLAGGACGTVGRYMLTGLVYRLLGSSFPYGTLAVNTLGCLAIGFLGALSEQKMILQPDMRLFLMVGILGAFTTFSALMYESWKLMQVGSFLLACLNMMGSLLLGLVALWIGYVVAMFFLK